jgi:glycosyltransferase involved in cell wall biosynthesis
VVRSQGGLWFSTYDEFVGTVEWLRQHPDLAAQMGANGRQYAVSNFTWSAVLDRLEGRLRAWGPAAP